MPSYDINWLAVVVATVATQALGALWYGPLFGKAWLRAVGKTREDMAGAGVGYAVAALSSLVAAIALALILNLIPDPGLAEGIIWGLIVGVGFVATSGLTTSVFEEGRQAQTVIFVAFQIVAFAIMGAILGAWR